MISFLPLNILLRKVRRPRHAEAVPDWGTHYTPEEMERIRADLRAMNHEMAEAARRVGPNPQVEAARARLQARVARLRADRD